MAIMDITDRLAMIGAGKHLDLADIVCADAKEEIERLRKKIKQLSVLRPQVINREAKRRALKQGTE